MIILKFGVLKKEKFWLYKTTMIKRIADNSTVNGMKKHYQIKNVRESYKIMMESPKKLIYRENFFDIQSQKRLRIGI